MELFNTLNAIVTIDEHHWNEISKLAEIRHFKRNEYFLKKEMHVLLLDLLKKAALDL